MEFEIYMTNGRVFQITDVKCVREFYHFECDNPEETYYIDCSFVDFYVEVDNEKANVKEKGSKGFQKHGRQKQKNKH